jgi:CheY-like chemotaxis protein
VASEQEQKVVLCIDDSDCVLECLEFYLRELGYSVLTASCGERGLELIALHQVDVVIVDYHMPRLNGYQFALAMKDLGMQTPIIMFSGEAEVPRHTLNIVNALVAKARLDSLSAVAQWVDRLTSGPPSNSAASSMHTSAEARGHLFH